MHKPLEARQITRKIFLYITKKKNLLGTKFDTPGLLLLPRNWRGSPTRYPPKSNDDY